MNEEPCPHTPPDPYVLPWALRSGAPSAGPGFTPAQAMVHRAWEEGTELAFLLKDLPETRLRGRVQDLGPEGFSLFHSGQREGFLWHIPWAGVAAVAYVVPRPGG